MHLSINTQPLLFEPVVLHFYEAHLVNVFAQKNNRTLGETVRHKRYARLQADVLQHYPAYLDMPLGLFLSQLKTGQNPFYRRFLNPYGDEIFSNFAMDDPIQLKQKGLYAFATNTTLQYLGRCRDSFSKRINQGYGRIHPKNCYLDGQATNCHLNALITRYQSQVRLHIYPMTDDTTIVQREKDLIQTYNPPWNIALKRVFEASDAS